MLLLLLLFLITWLYWIFDIKSVAQEAPAAPGAMCALTATHVRVRVLCDSSISYFYTFDFCPSVKYLEQKMFPLNFVLHIFTSQRFYGGEDKGHGEG